MHIKNSRLRKLGRIVLVPLLCWLAVATPAQAQQAARWDVFRSVTSGGGPADDAITSLTVDGGTLWVGTHKGLSRYDGAVWNTYTTTVGLPADDIRALLIDRKGYLWIGTARGVLLLEPGRRWAEGRRLAKGPSAIEALSPASDGGVWVGALSGASYWPASADTSADPGATIPSPDPIEAIWEQAAGDVWLGTRGGGLIHRRVTGTTETYTEAQRLPSPWIHALWGSRQGDLWVGTQAGACRLSLATPYAGCRPLDQLRGTSVNRFLPDPDGSVWVATDVGVWRFRNDHLVETIRPANETGLRSDDVIDLAQDAEGQLWLGTTDGLARRRARLWAPGLPESRDLRENDVKAIAEDLAGNLWVATARGLKWRNARGQWQSIVELDGQPVRCLWADTDGSLWLCRERGFAHMLPSGRIEAPGGNQGLLGLTVNAIRRGPDGALWLATDRGIWRWDGTTWTPYRRGAPAGGPANDAVYSIALDGEAGLWFGTFGGLSHFDGQQWGNPARAGCLVKDLVEALAWEQPDRLWVGTDQGLILCEKGRQQHWNEHQGLIARRVRALALEPASPSVASEPERMTLWIGTFDGLSRADRLDDTSEQLPVVSFAGESLPHDRVQAIFASRSAGVLIGTPNGLWAYQPSPAPPQVRLRRSVGTETFDTMRQPDQPLELAYDQPAALFAVGGDLRTPAENLIYRYTIDAGEQHIQGWSLDGTLPITEVLQPGTTIVVTAWAYDRDFNQSADPARLQVTRRPVPLPNQPWFPELLVLVSTVLVGATLGSVRAVRAWRLYGYHDLVLTIGPGRTPDAYMVQLAARRRLACRLLGPVSRPGVAPPGPLSAQDATPVTVFRGSRLTLSGTGCYERAVDWGALDQGVDRLRSDQSDEELLRRLGEQLYVSLFSPEATAYLSRHLRLGHEGVRLRLRFGHGFADGDRLATLPWEFLHGGDQPGFLTIERNVALVRDLSPEERAKTPRARRPLKLLVAWAAPADLPRLDVEEEVEQITATLQELEHRKKTVLCVLAHVQPETFRQSLQEGYDLIHFIGHGGVKGSDSVLFFEDEDGDSVSMALDELIDLVCERSMFTDHTPKLVVLNACRTAEAGEGLAGLAAALVQQAGLPAVVGMGYPISTSAAAIFSKAFYETLVRQGQVDYAVAQGRAALAAAIGAGKRDCGVPRLYIRTPASVVFEMR